MGKGKRRRNGLESRMSWSTTGGSEGAMVGVPVVVKGMAEARNSQRPKGQPQQQGGSREQAGRRLATVLTPTIPRVGKRLRMHCVFVNGVHVSIEPKSSYWLIQPAKVLTPTIPRVGKRLRMYCVFVNGVHACIEPKSSY